MNDDKEQSDLIGQAIEDGDAVIFCLTKLSEHFGVPLKLDSAEIMHIAGYLRECSECDSSEEISACLKRCYENILNDNFMNKSFWRCAADANITN